MTINTQKLLSIFDTAAQTYGWADGTGTVGQFQTALTNYQRTRKDLEQAIDAQTAEIARLREAIGEAIRLLGMDRPIDPTDVLRAALSGESHD